MQAPLIKQIEIDQKWVCETIETPKNLVQCPVCFQVILQPLECASCCRLFCKEDYKNFKDVKDYCPLCKAKPWVIKPSVHLVYKQILAKLTFFCKECKDDKKYSREQLNLHLKTQHQLALKETTEKIYKYFIKFPNSNKIKLTKYQNLQIYQKSSPNLDPQYKIFDKNFGILKIDMANMKVFYKDSTKTTVTGELIKQAVSDPKNDSQLNTEEQYVIWQFEEFNKTQYFLEEHQIILEEGYQQYETNPAFCQIHLDMRNIGIRYRIDFDKMEQINLKTKFERKISRRKIKLGKK